MSQVDTSGLAKVGAAVSRTSAGFAGAQPGRAGVLAAGGALDGWATGAALADATRAWGAFLQQVAAQVDTVGAGLTRSAEEFRAADAAAGNRVTVAGHSPVRLF